MTVVSILLFIKIGLINYNLFGRRIIKNIVKD
jgi:amino acid permease